MVDFSLLHKKARHDIRVCLQVWSELLRESLGERLKYAYAKGSAVKTWDSAIDYVPVVSDVDIHVYLSDDAGLFAGYDDAFKRSMELSSLFERAFYQREPDPLHLPRTQIVLLNDALKQKGFTMPRLSDVQPIVGNPVFPSQPSPETTRHYDLLNLRELGEYLDAVPLKTVDRAGFDFWSLIRTMIWRVSPTPVRLLTQRHEDPMEVWSWNRTRIAEELKTHGHNILEGRYRGFYEAGWRLFILGFTSSEDFRGMVYNGYYLLRGCRDAVGN
ncbi:MAG: hypothetical protein ACE5H4_13690 [Candidatus Thorarchaeota archaeon]